MIAVLLLLACADSAIDTGDTGESGTPLQCGQIEGDQGPNGHVYGGVAPVGPTVVVGGVRELPDGHSVTVDTVGWLDPGGSNDTGWVRQDPPSYGDADTGGIVFRLVVADDSFPGGSTGAATPCRARLH